MKKIEGKVFLFGPPNTGKTSLFNFLTQKRQKVANYPGITTDCLSAILFTPHGNQLEIFDLPGIYRLNPHSPEQELALSLIEKERNSQKNNTLILCVLNATTLENQLPLILELIDAKYSVILVLNMMDEVRRKKIHIDVEKLSQELEIPVIPCSLKSRKSLFQLKQALRFPFPPRREDSNLLSKVERIAELVISKRNSKESHFSDLLDRFFLNPIAGWVSFLGAMFGLFWILFSFSAIPMSYIESMVGALSKWVSFHLPPGSLRDLIVDGIIQGVGNTLIFLPQIFLLFTLLGILESSGYLARGSFLVNRLMNYFGLGGKSFVPLLSSYACAIPGILSARAIEDPKQRLRTILIAPWMSCSARLPVYILMLSLLFSTQNYPSWVSALSFIFLYVLGTGTALIFSKLLALGTRSKPLDNFFLELPPYRFPDFPYIFSRAIEKCLLFLRKAGTLILTFSIIMWVLYSYPKSSDNVSPSQQLEQSFMGRMGKKIEPLIQPLGYDWRIGTALIWSFAAREVFVSSMAMSYGLENAEDTSALKERLQKAKREDGSKLFTPLTCISILIFYVYALQCIPTIFATRSETESWKWAIFQFFGMMMIAYLFALLFYQTGRFFGYS